MGNLPSETDGLTRTTMQPCFALADNELSITLPDSSKKRLRATAQLAFEGWGPFSCY
jgi:hypothetical protein